MKSFRNFSRPLYAALLAAPLLLAACTENGPWPMPTGYVYHHDQYKAPPGPKPVLKKWEYKHGLRPEPQLEPAPSAAGQLEAASVPAVETTAAGPVTHTTWQLASDELVARLIADFGRPAEAVWLEADAGGSADFDRVLRRSLGANKIDVSAAPGAGPFTLRYSVGSSGDTAGHWLLTITLISGGRRVESESGLYSFADSAPAAMAPSMATDAPVMLTGPAPAIGAGPALVIDSSPVAAHARPKPSGMADDIEPGPRVRPVPPEHVPNDEDIKPGTVVPAIAPAHRNSAPEARPPAGDHIPNG